VRDRLERQPVNLHAAADQAVADARLEIVDQRTLEDDAVLDLGRGVKIHRLPLKPVAHRFMLGDNSEVWIKW